MKWKSAEIACMNKVIYRRLKSAEKVRDYLFKKYGSKQYIYHCSKGGIGRHYHLTVKGNRDFIST